MARQTRGRQRIPMRLIQSQDDLYASFSKRRLGLFKKASELTTLCAADVGIIVFSPTDNPFSFFSPNMESVTERYYHPDQPLKQSARAIDAYARARIKEQNRRLDQMLEQRLIFKEREEGLDGARDRGWWEETSVESLSKEQVREWIGWFKNFKERVENEIQHNNVNGPTSSNAQAATRQCFHPCMFGGGESSSYFLSSQYRNPVFSPPTDVGEHPLPPTFFYPLHAQYTASADEETSEANQGGN